MTSARPASARVHRKCYIPEWATLVWFVCWSRHKRLLAHAWFASSHSSLTRYNSRLYARPTTFTMALMTSPNLLSFRRAFFGFVPNIPNKRHRLRVLPYPLYQTNAFQHRRSRTFPVILSLATLSLHALASCFGIAHTLRSIGAGRYRCS